MMLLRKRDFARLRALEALATAVRANIQGLPDHPWIPGARCGTVAEALVTLDKTEETSHGDSH